MTLVDNTLGDTEAAVCRWQQGDCVVGEQWFHYAISPESPLTDEAKNILKDDPSATIAEVEVRGLVVLTQTCDIVRKLKDRPYVEVAPLIVADDYSAIKAGRRPQYAAVPALESSKFVADLDRVMTLEKSLLASWSQTNGCRTDAETRAFAAALGRKRMRFAFPDRFVEWLKPIEDRIKGKHGKLSPEGQALLKFQEIRVKASPDWRDTTPELLFYFIREIDVSEIEQKTLKNTAAALMNLPNSDFSHQHQVTTVEDISAKDYLESDQLDLGYLSK